MDADRQCLVFYTQFINLITIQHIISGLRLSLASWVWSLVDTVLLYYYRLSLASWVWSLVDTVLLYYYRLSLASWVWSLVDTVLLYYYRLSLAGGFPECGPSSIQSSCTSIVYRWLGGFLSVVPRRYSPLVLVSFIVGWGVS